MKSKLNHVVKVEFQENTKNPERIFRSMAVLIEAFRKIDHASVKSLSSDLTHIVTLDSIAISSLISRLHEEIEIPASTDVSSEEVESEEIEEKVAEYIEESRQTIIDTINENTVIDHISAIRDVQAKINNLAESKNLHNSLTYNAVDPLKIANNLARLAKATSYLGHGESAMYGVSEPNATIQKNCTVNVQSIKESLTNETLVDDTEVILKIKKVDLLGNSKWTFLHGRQSLDAHISDADWLSEFHEGNLPISSGDVLRGRARVENNYNSRGELTSTTWDIYQVDTVTSSLDDGQIGVFGEA